jgi:glycosyltransferase involved in cell wall biosynthesis
MTIGINASFLRKQDTGIGQVTVNFVRKLIELNVEDISFVLYVEEESGLELPRNFEERVFLPRLYKRDDLVRKIMWEKKLLPREAKRDGCDVFLSLYQSATVFKKNKKGMDSRLHGNDSRGGSVRHIMLVHDTVWKIFPEYLNNWRKKKYYKSVEEGIAKADKILTVSENSKKDVVKYFGIDENKIDVHYVDCDEVFKNQDKKSNQSACNDARSIVGREPLEGMESADEDLGDADFSTSSLLNARDSGRNDKAGDDDIQGDDREDSASSDGKEDNYIFYVGGFDVRKNVDRLLEAYGMLWRKWEENKNDDLEGHKNPLGPPSKKGEDNLKNSLDASSVSVADKFAKGEENQPPPNPLLSKERGPNRFPDLVLAGKFHSHLVPLVTNLPDKIKEVSKKYKLPKEKIKQVGFVEEKDLPSWYGNAELFCYPTLYEGFGLPILEAQNCGCPVVTSNVSSILEVASVDNAILVNPESTEEIAGAMFNCLTSEGLRNRLISEGKKNAMRFSWDRFAKEVLIEALKEGSRV